MLRLLMFILAPLVIFSACSHRSYQGGKDVATASWYGEPFHGRLTASGERYDMYGISAAHKEFPFGSRFRMTHPETGRSVVVTVNDRGPFVAGRDFDLSYGAARKLGMIEEGVAELWVEPLGTDNRYLASREERQQLTHQGQFSLQMASFRDRAKAEDFLAEIHSHHPDAFIDPATTGGTKVYRVMSGLFSSKNDALAALSNYPASGSRPFVKQL
jgi:rare lipoprotein A